MPGVFGWGWDATNEVWRPIKVSATGALYIVETVDALNDIGDVDVAAPTDDFFLYWDDPASKWKARALVAGDIPNLDAAKITSGTFAVVRGGTGLAAIAQGGILYASAPNTLSRLAPGAANRVLRSTAANALQFAALVAADIPNLDAAKVTAGIFAEARIPGSISGEGHIFIVPFAYVSIGQGTWVWWADVASAFYGSGFWYNSTHADGDEISYKVYLAKGTYTLGVMGITDVDCGIIDIYIDAAEEASFDLYSDPQIPNVWFTQAGITVGTSGLLTLKVLVDGKHASSNNHFCKINAIILWRTA